jgi:predicted enzyme related to lactoylglutathione lyase
MGGRDRAARERTHAVKVRRIINNITAADMAAAKRFYQDVLGLEVVMDPGWIAT